MLTRPKSRPHVGNFGRLWLGEGVSVLGNATTSVLLPLLAVVHLHAGPGWMGTITAAAWLPWLVIGLPAGAWIDRLDPRRVMIAADVLSAAALGSVPVAWWLGALTLLHLVLAASAGGCAAVFFRTSYMKLLPLVVDRAGLEAANSRLLGTESGLQMAGPGLAALLTAVASAATGLVVDVVSFLVSALCLWRIRPVTVAEKAYAASESGRQVAPDAPASLIEQIKEGIRFVIHDPPVRIFTIIGGVSNFGLTGYAALLILYLSRSLGLASSEVALVVMVGSAGGLVGALVAPRLARRVGAGRASTLLFLAGGVSALLIGAPVARTQIGLTAAGLALVGAAVVGGNVVRGAWRSRYVPADVMGRVLTASQIVNYGTMPLAGVVAGSLGQSIGIRPTILVMAGVHCLACSSILLTRMATRRDLPTRVAVAGVRP